MVICKGLFLSLFLEIHMRQEGDLKIDFQNSMWGIRGFHFVVPESLTREQTQIYYIIFAGLTLFLQSDLGQG